MTPNATAEPPFDSRWLELLAEHCGARSASRPRIIDLYLEHRLELRVSSDGGAALVERCNTEGVAVRWQMAGRERLEAVTGTSPRAVAELLARAGDASGLALARPLPPPELDAPRGFGEWATELATRRAAAAPELVFMLRRAAVVRAEGWCTVTAPPLVRVRMHGDLGAALLAVWPHPSLAEWLGRLVEPPPERVWRPAAGSEPPVIFGRGSAGGLLHELIGHLCESDLVTAGDSPLAPLAGASLTTDRLQVVDDPRRGELPGAFDNDDEGESARAVTLVDGGRLCGWLCDRRGAELLGCAAGRGRRGAWNQSPLPRLSNLVVAPGDTDPEALERDHRHALLVTRLAGACVDPISSRAVIRVERGWEIHNGRRRRPLAPCALTGSVVDILSSVDPAIGSDQTPDWRLGWCVKSGSAVPTGSLAPTLLVRRLEVL